MGHRKRSRYQVAVAAHVHAEPTKKARTRKARKTESQRKKPRCPDCTFAGTLSYNGRCWCPQCGRAWDPAMLRVTPEHTFGRHIMACLEVLDMTVPGGVAKVLRAIAIPSLGDVGEDLVAAAHTCGAHKLANIISKAWRAS